MNVNFVAIKFMLLIIVQLIGKGQEMRATLYTIVREISDIFLDISGVLG